MHFSYCELVEKIYDNLIAAQVLSASVSIVICLCVNLNEFDLISAIFFLVSAYSMSVYCIVGTQIEFAVSLLLRLYLCASLLRNLYFAVRSGVPDRFLPELARAQLRSTQIIYGDAAAGAEYENHCTARPSAAQPGHGAAGKRVGFYFGDLLAKNSI